MRESDRFFGLRTQHQRYHLLSAATLNNSRNRNFVHQKDHLRLAAAGLLGPRFRLPPVDRRHPSSVGMGGSLLPRLRACRKGQLSGAYEEGVAGMLTIIKASLLGSALMLLASCTGYLTNYQTPCVQGHVCQCVQYTTLYRSWLDCRDYGRVKSLTR